MPILSDIPTSKTPPQPIDEAHFVETHWAHPKLSWAEACEKVAQLFPRETRPERPRKWFGLLAGTHWPGQLPPGNGPYYIPAWAFKDEDEEKRIAEILKDAGFKEMDAHVVYLRQNSEYLADAMRAAGDRTWTANPITARAYIYPDLRKPPEKDLRDYNVELWRI